MKKKKKKKKKKKGVRNRKEGNNFEKNIIEKDKNEPQLFYRYVNGKLKSREGVDKLKVEGTVYEDALQQAEVINKIFQTIFIRESEFRMNNIIATRIFNWKHKSRRKWSKTTDVRKVPGLHGVSNWIMKECSNQLAEKLHSIIESSLKESRVPLDWKRANIVPIHKGGDKEEPLHYIPASLTSVVAKICEKIVKDKWLKFLEETNTFSGCQFGFRGGRSCITNLLSFYSSDWCDIGKRRVGWLHLPGQQEGFFAEVDGRLFEQQRNEKSNKRSEVRMVQCEKWSSSRISIGPSDVLRLCNIWQREWIVM